MNSDHDKRQTIISICLLFNDTSNDQWPLNYPRDENKTSELTCEPWRQHANSYPVGVRTGLQTQISIFLPHHVKSRISCNPQYPYSILVQAINTPGS